MSHSMELLSSGVGFILLCGVVCSVVADASFDNNYKITYGFDHIVSFRKGTQLQISLDNSSGSGFESKDSYGSGYFPIKIKTPNQTYTGGIVTAFYVTSKFETHDELDFEFLGAKDGDPVLLQTNVYVDGVGGREQKVRLWFDPAADFHEYAILWNQHQIIFYVDKIPIRVYKNSRNGAIYPTGRAMQIQASIWDGSTWFINKANYSYAPFTAYFEGFEVNGCPIDHNSTNISPCFSENFWWNSPKYWKLGPAQQRVYEHVKNKYSTYDYCYDRPRYPQLPPECLG